MGGQVEVELALEGDAAVTVAEFGEEPPRAGLEEHSASKTLLPHSRGASPQQSSWRRSLR